MAKYGYARVSTGDQHPEAQQDRLREAGVDDEHLFTDHGVSGTLAHRPEWDKLLARLQPGDVLCCTKLDRIGRSAISLLKVFESFRERGIDLRVLDQAIDTTGPLGKMIFTILAAFAEWERNLIIERTLDGQQSVRLKGNLRRSLGGLPPLGFCEDPDGGDDWTIHPEQAAWLAGAAQLVLADPEHNIDAAHRALDPMTDSAGRKVNAKMLRAALQRPASAGLIVTGGHVIGGPEAGGPLDRVTFDRLEVLFESRKRGGRPAETGRFPFATVLACDRCGNQLTGEARKHRDGSRRDYYRCKNPHAGVPHPCRGCSVAADDVHDLMAEFFAARTEGEGALTVALPEPPGSRPEVAEAEARIADLEQQIEELMDNRLDGILPAAAYKRLLAKAGALLREQRDEHYRLIMADPLTRDDLPPGPLSGRWKDLTSAQQLAVVRNLLETPVMVRPGNGGPSALTAYDRITLTERR